MINIDFKFRAVGQGAFYSGVFKHHYGKQFSFVYDCGTNSTRQYIDQEIINFVSETNNQKIDILFISHFHSDHTNKISELLNQTGGAKYAILPYLTPEELLIAYTDVITTGGDPDSLAFIQNPTSFLLQRKVEKIIYIHPNDEPGSGDNDEPFIEDIDPELPDFEFIISNQLRENRNIVEKQSSVSHFYDSGRFSIMGLWEFKFFNKPRTPAIINTFIREVNLLLGVFSFDFDDIANYIETNTKTFESTFNQIYSNNFGARQLINDTSLVIYHGVYKANLHNHPLRPNWPYHFYPATLLTGDIDMNLSCLFEMNRKWVEHRYFKDIRIFQVPHHGSKKNFIIDVFTRFPNVKFWIINFGLGNKHKHPNQEVINLIVNNKSRHSHIKNNTQTSDFLCRITYPY